MTNGERRMANDFVTLDRWIVESLNRESDVTMQRFNGLLHFVIPLSFVILDFIIVSLGIWRTPPA